MSLAERLVLLHLGSTAVLLLALGVVTAGRHALEAWESCRGRVRDPAPTSSLQQVVVRVPEPHVVDLRSSREPGVAAGARRSS